MKKFLSNGAWSLLNQFVRVGSLVAITIALGRHFGPQLFGSLAVGFALVRIFAVAATFGSIACSSVTLSIKKNKPRPSSAKRSG